MTTSLLKGYSDINGLKDCSWTKTLIKFTWIKYLMIETVRSYSLSTAMFRWIFWCLRIDGPLSTGSDAWPQKSNVSSWEWKKGDGSKHMLLLNLAWIVVLKHGLVIDRWIPWFKWQRTEEMLTAMKEIKANPLIFDNQSFGENWKC